MTYIHLLAEQYQSQSLQYIPRFPSGVAESDELIQTLNRKTHPQTSFDAVLDGKDSLSFCIAHHNTNTKCHEIIHRPELDLVIFSIGSSKYNLE
jgi:hypothetical protein